MCNAGARFKNRSTSALSEGFITSASIKSRNVTSMIAICNDCLGVADRNLNLAMRDLLIAQWRGISDIVLASKVRLYHARKRISQYYFLQ